MCTRKHFIAVAAALKAQRVEMQRVWLDPKLFAIHDDTCKAIASTFATINPNFDRARFLAACGL